MEVEVRPELLLFTWIFPFLSSSVFNESTFYSRRHGKRRRRKFYCSFLPRKLETHRCEPHHAHKFPAEGGRGEFNFVSYFVSRRRRRRRQRISLFFSSKKNLGLKEVEDEVI